MKRVILPESETSRTAIRRLRRVIRSHAMGEYEGNALAPPENEKGAVLHAPIPKSATPHYKDRNSAQVCFAMWQSEAGRILAEYWRSGNQKHLAAFVRHTVAMRAHQMRLAQ